MDDDVRTANEEAELARYREGLKCPECDHGWYLHGTSKGCTSIVKVNGDPLCHCAEPRRVWDAATAYWEVG